MSAVAADKFCAVCGDSAALMCERCMEPYCNRNCQAADWRRHKYSCIPMPVLVPNINAQCLEEQQVSAKPLVSKPNHGAIPKSNPKPINKEVNTVDPVSASSPVKSVGTPTGVSPEQLSSVWRETFLPPLNDFSECRVTHMKSDGVIWVVDVSNVELMEQFNEGMQRVKSMLQLAKCVKEDSLVVVQGEKNIQRGHVISVDSQSKTAMIRLIDHGSVVDLPLLEVYDPLPRMADIKAFAIQVKLLSNTGVQSNNHLTLRFLGPKTQEGFYPVQLKPKMTIPLNFPIKMLQMNSEVTVVTILEGCLHRDEQPIALLQISTIVQINAAMSEKLDGKPSQQQPISVPLPLDTCTTVFLATRTNQGYRRAFLLDVIDAPPTRTYLVYEMDEGRISITTDVRRIPSELLGHPIQTFAMKLNNEGQQVPLKELLESCGPDLTVKLRLESIQGQEKVRRVGAALLSKGKQMAEVELNTFMGEVSTMGHKYWREAIENGTLVRITHIVDYKEFFISSIETMFYANLFKRMEKKCRPFGPSDQILIGSIVLVASPKLGHFRGTICGIENDLFSVHNIDTGATYLVERQFLRMSCRFLENMPVSLSRVQLKSVCDIPECAVIPKNAGCELMKELLAENVEFRVEFVGSSTQLVDLHFGSGEATSLALRILPLMFTPVSFTTQEVAAAKPAAVAVPASVAAPAPAKVSAPAKVPAPAVVPKELTVKTRPAASEMSNELIPPLPLSPPASPIIETKEPQQQFQRHFYKDVPKILIPLGERIDAFLLNASELSKSGYITACHFKNDDESMYLQDLFSLINSEGKSSHPNIKSYIPCVGEMCLSMFSEDNSWYRAVCEEIIGDKARVLYCDFGNWEIVSFKNLKPISSRLVQAIIATKCYVEGYEKSQKFSQWEEHIKTNLHVLCRVKEGPDSNSRTITIPDLEKLVTQKT
ncbi:uncharacterized protein LOC117589665 [Drosophila guanche]|uniref:Blast:Tudor domain-containing protein 1 n=1 Tax=Drosophila guanche TaxID=7266 RepID=A0A3B0K1G5_DROGU|nr:uncharacterized protein LOC117589665 [Drosophila guanche]XP_034137694.1 uncharacterized protein LOC117589665 [Drosophila guanche]SPP88107.1 blast:Tudor domain-containing protein 1 [Drosophila guanche]